MSAPFAALIQEGAVTAWSHCCQFALNRIKSALIQVPCLKLPDPAESFTVVTDASGIGIGAALLQQWRQVSFQVRGLPDTEKKWSATEQQVRVMVYHIKNRRCYLEGVHYTAVTDHQPSTVLQVKVAFTT